MANIRTVDFLPEIFQTPVNRQFLNATLDQLVQEPQFQKTQGYVGRRVGPGVNSADSYVVEPTKNRTDYQLEPGVISLDSDTLDIKDAITYPGINDALSLQGANITNPDSLYKSEYYAWDPFVDFDKFVNYSQYYWQPSGPFAVDVSASDIPLTDNFVVTRENGVYTFSGINGNNPVLTLARGGNYTFQVTDAALCSLNATTSITSPGGISSVNVSSTNSSCSSNDGTITVQVIGGIAPYNYTLVNPDGDTLSTTSNQTTEVYSNLASGTYSIFVEDTTGCAYTTEITLISQDKFTTTLLTTGTTCGNTGGIVQITISSQATLPVTYSIDGTNNIVGSNQLTVTYTNVSVGQHLLTVTDADGCSISTPFSISSTPPVDFSLYSTSCGSGNQGTITAFITQGTAPFDFTWSNNIAGNPQEITVEGLTGGTYSLIVQDFYGCSLARQTTIECNAKCVTYQTYTMGSEVFNILSPTKHGINQILVEGFNDLTSTNTNCTLLSAVYTAQVELQPDNTFLNSTFYTGTSLVDVPSDNLWFTTITKLLQSVDGITSVNINPLTNQITISANPGSAIVGQELSVKLIIVYDIICLT